MAHFPLVFCFIRVFFILRESRLDQVSGLAFLPDTVHMGLAGCASRGRSAGPAPVLAQTTADSEQTERAAHAWANRIWLAQLGQWRGLTGEIAHSITLTYPTARSFYRDLCQHQSQTGTSAPTDARYFTLTTSFYGIFYASLNDCRTTEIQITVTR